MARAEGKINFQLSVTPEDRDMIKADAKALGMTSANYVVMVCKLVNESAREIAAEEMAKRFTKAVMRGYNDAIKKNDE